MTLILDNDDVLFAADVVAVIEALEEAMRIEHAGGVETVPRVNLPFSPKGFFRVMPAVIESMDLMGLKVFYSSRSSEVRYLIGLWSIESGELKALVDACHLTAIRTGAVTAMAHRAIAGDHAVEEIGIIGSGLEARTNLEAICAVTEISRARVFSPSPERRERFAREMSDRLEIKIRPVDTPVEAAECPAVLAATNTGIGSGRIALEGQWVRAAGHVDSIGSTMPALRELDAEVFGRAELIVLDTLDAVEESGDLIAARESGNWDESKVRTLASLFAPGGSVRPAPDSLTIFKSVGTALQDLIAADAIFRVAAARGLGKETDFLYGKEFVS